MDQQKLHEIQDELINKADALLKQSTDMTRLIEGFRNEFEHFTEEFDKVS